MLFLEEEKKKGYELPRTRIVRNLCISVFTHLCKGRAEAVIEKIYLI